MKGAKWFEKKRPKFLLRKTVLEASLTRFLPFFVCLKVETGYRISHLLLDYCETQRNRLNQKIQLSVDSISSLLSLSFLSFFLSPSQNLLRYSLSNLESPDTVFAVIIGIQESFVDTSCWLHKCRVREREEKISDPNVTNKNETKNDLTFKRNRKENVFLTFAWSAFIFVPNFVLLMLLLLKFAQSVM